MLTGMTTPPNTITVNWVGGEVQTISRGSWTDAGALYTTAYTTSHRDLASAPVASGVGATARLSISGNCVGTPPTIGYCLEGTRGAKATGGKFDYQFPLEVLTDGFLVNTITASGPAPTPSATLTRSGSFALGTTWSVAGTYSNGHIMPARSVSLPALADAEVNEGNECDHPVAVPLPATWFPT
jgi:hypothetical protein